MVKNAIKSKVPMQSAANFYEYNIYKIFEGFPLAIRSLNLN